MKTRITVITPVHIGTGEVKSAYEYKRKNDVLYNFNLSDIFSNIPPNVILDDNFLQNISEPINNNAKESTLKNLNTGISKHIPYWKLKSAYQLDYSFEENRYKNISEQIKSLNKPIIPGSSIKGAIMTMIEYDWVCHHISDFVRRCRDNSKLENIMYYTYNADKEFYNFIKSFRSCFSCADAIFDHMTCLEGIRFSVDPDKDTELPLGDIECITEEQEYEENILTIDYKKVEILNYTYKGKRYLEDFKKYLNYKTLINVGNKYFQDLINEELETDAKYGYYSEFYLEDTLKYLKGRNFKNGFLMRIGMHTNYFFKSVSYAIKNNKPAYYKDHFYPVFSNKRGKIVPKADTMPSTRSLYFDGEEYYYPGVIKIEFTD